MRRRLSVETEGIRSPGFADSRVTVSCCSNGRQAVRRPSTKLVYSLFPVPASSLLFCLFVASLVSVSCKSLFGMSKSSKSKGVDKQMDSNIVQFCSVTSASVKDARRFLDKYKRVDIAIDAYYSDPSAGGAAGRRTENPSPSTSKLNALFDKYRDKDGKEITVDGTIQLCEDLEVNPEDVVLLAVAYELQSPKMGEWHREGWVEGWKKIGCDSISFMKTALRRLRDKLVSDPEYFQRVYNYTFDFAKAEGQRSLALDTAQALWELLMPAGLQGGALAHKQSNDDDDDHNMNEQEGWTDEYTHWWFDFWHEKGSRGVSKDTWVMFLDFVRSIDAKFEKYDMEAAWPSTIDDFVEYARKRMAQSS